MTERIWTIEELGGRRIEDEVTAPYPLREPPVKQEAAMLAAVAEHQQAIIAAATGTKVPEPPLPGMSRQKKHAMIDLYIKQALGLGKHLPPEMKGRHHQALQHALNLLEQL